MKGKQDQGIAGQHVSQKPDWEAHPPARPRSCAITAKLRRAPVAQAPGGPQAGTEPRPFAEAHLSWEAHEKRKHRLVCAYQACHTAKPVAASSARTSQSGGRFLRQKLMQPLSHGRRSKGQIMRAHAALRQHRGYRREDVSTEQGGTTTAKVAQRRLEPRGRATGRRGAGSPFAGNPLTRAPFQLGAKEKPASREARRVLLGLFDYAKGIPQVCSSAHCTDTFARTESWPRPPIG